MGAVTQSLKLHAEHHTPDLVKVVIPKKGKIKPSSVKRQSSNALKIQVIQIFHSTNYLAGKITFEKREDI